MDRVPVLTEVRRELQRRSELVVQRVPGAHLPTADDHGDQPRGAHRAHGVAGGGRVDLRHQQRAVRVDLLERLDHVSGV
jgi:hypothetical protein